MRPPNLRRRDLLLSAPAELGAEASETALAEVLALRRLPPMLEELGTGFGRCKARALQTEKTPEEQRQRSRVAAHSGSLQ